MKVRNFYITFIACIFGLIAFGQKSINNYKYIIVPDQYEFNSGKDKYQLNSLTKFLFNKYGFTAYMVGDEFPEDLTYNKCLGLTSEVKKIKGFLRTKLQIDLVDCDGNIVLSSGIGESKEKQYAKAYNLALREAFNSIRALSYTYEPSDAVLSRSLKVSSSNEEEVKTAEAKIKELEEEVKALKEKKETDVVETEMKEDVSEAVNEAVSVVEDVVEEVKETAETKVEEKADVLYAQPIDNGFQLVDTTPKKVMVLLYSGVKDVFIVKGEDAIVYKKGDVWIYAENDSKSLKSKGLSIKF
ncbi:hypothetical protein [Winogradskyella sp. 3972H.M.0a.05]|uniref:hypothetical protein n=1 Tax=Winogradskyella sp. 3972H.M.0a.05 TaxID=2950277 RepID=UPI003397CF31